MKTIDQLIKELNFFDLINKLKILFKRIFTQIDNAVNTVDNQDNIDGAKEFLQPITAPEGTEPNHLVTLSQIENEFIPLSGTTEGNPVTGDLYLDDAVSLKAVIGGGGFYLGDLENISLQIPHSEGTTHIEIRGEETSKGLVGFQFFNKNNDPNSFAQLGDIAVINETATPLSLATLNSNYATQGNGFKVICPVINLIYIKSSLTTWEQIATTTVS